MDKLIHPGWLGHYVTLACTGCGTLYSINETKAHAPERCYQCSCGMRMTIRDNAISESTQWERTHE